MSQYEKKSEDVTEDAETGVLGSPLTFAQTAAITAEREAAMKAAMLGWEQQAPEVYEARRQLALQRRQYDWDVLALEFEAVQKNHGTRQAIQNLVFEIAVGVCTSYMPNCFGLIVNDGSQEMQTVMQNLLALRAAKERAEDTGLNPNPTPRPRKPSASSQPSAPPPTSEESGRDPSTSGADASDGDTSPAP